MKNIVFASVFLMITCTLVYSQEYEKKVIEDSWKKFRVIKKEKMHIDSLFVCDVTDIGKTEPAIYKVVNITDIDDYSGRLDFRQVGGPNSYSGTSRQYDRLLIDSTELILFVESNFRYLSINDWKNMRNEYKLAERRKNSANEQDELKREKELKQNTDQLLQKKSFTVKYGLE